MPTHSNIAGQEPSTVSFRVASVELTRGSTAEDQEILCIGDPDTSNAIAAVLNTGPASTAWALAVREVVAQSTTMQVSSVAGAVITRSSAADMAVRAFQSTAADLNVTVSGYSTTAQVSSVAGVVTVSPISSSGVSMSTDTDPASTKQGLIVRQVGFSTTVNVSSLAGTVLAAVTSPLSSAAPATGDSAVIVRQVGYSTTVNISSLAGAVITRSSAADMLVTASQGSPPWTVSVTTPLSSAAPATGDSAVIVRQVGYSTTVNISSLAGRALVDQNSTAWFSHAVIRDSSGVGFLGTTTRPTTGAQGLGVRTVLNDLLSTAFSTQGNNSTSNTVVSSVATLRHKVFAYSITSTVQAINTLSFASGLSNVIWTMQMQSLSSGIAGANLAVSPPSWLFATAAGEPLVFKETGTTGTYHLSFSYFSEA